MIVAYPQHEASDLAVTWPDMRESFPCEASPKSVGYCGGTNPADWIVHRVVCCGAGRPINLLCTACKDLILQLPAAHCACCLRVFQPASTAITSIEPLGVS